MRTSRLLPLLFAPLLLLVAASSMRAQHCGYCGSTMTLIEPRNAATDSVIPGLRITLIDSAGQPCTRTIRQWQNRTCALNQVAPIETIIFQQLPDTGIEWDLRYGRRLIKNRYYVDNIVHWGSHTGDTVVIEDVDGEANGGFFPTVRIPLDSCPWTSLCSGTHRPWLSDDPKWKWEDDSKVVMMGVPHADPLPMDRANDAPAIGIVSVPDVLPELVIDAPVILSNVLLLVEPTAPRLQLPALVLPIVAPNLPDALLK